MIQVTNTYRITCARTLKLKSLNCSFQQRSSSIWRSINSSFQVFGISDFITHFSILLSLPSHHSSDWLHLSLKNSDSCFLSLNPFHSHPLGKSHTSSSPQTSLSRYYTPLSRYISHTQINTQLHTLFLKKMGHHIACHIFVYPSQTKWVSERSSLSHVVLWMV